MKIELDGYYFPPLPKRVLGGSFLVETDIF